MTNTPERALLRQFLEWYDTDLGMQDAHDLADEARALLAQPAPEGDRWRCAWCGTALGECKCVAQPVPEGEDLFDQGHPEGKPVLWLRMSEYEVVNLAEGLYSTASHLGKPINPLAALNTGDWTLALCWRLQAEIKRRGFTMKPNQTSAEMREHAASLASTPLPRAEAEAMVAEGVKLIDALNGIRPDVPDGAAKMVAWWVTALDWKRRAAARAILDREGT